MIDYDDRDFTSHLPFVMHIPPDERPLDILKLFEFHDQLVRRIPDYRVVMRDHAERILTWTAKMEPVRSALLSLLQKGA